MKKTSLKYFYEKLSLKRLKNLLEEVEYTNEMTTTFSGRFQEKLISERLQKLESELSLENVNKSIELLKEQKETFQKSLMLTIWEMKIADIIKNVIQYDLPDHYFHSHSKDFNENQTDHVNFIAYMTRRLYPLGIVIKKDLSTKMVHYYAIKESNQ